ncbi:uncharacterized protein LOC134536932 [Bacillus rossius redtenbacheri]|uniref:uncharacterized protein LOC134536932 n=1 Tax=Bacillus rossius redtenbacheri TaxID=93214 RepID=UPI002FDDF551
MDQGSGVGQDVNDGGETEEEIRELMNENEMSAQEKILAMKEELETLMAMKEKLENLVAAVQAEVNTQVLAAGSEQAVATEAAPALDPTPVTEPTLATEPTPATTRHVSLPEVRSWKRPFEIKSWWSNNYVDTRTVIETLNAIVKQEKELTQETYETILAGKSRLADATLGAISTRLRTHTMVAMTDCTGSLLFKVDRLRFTPVTNSLSERFDYYFGNNKKQGFAGIVPKMSRNDHVQKVVQVVKEFTKTSGEGIYDPKSKQGLWKSVTVRSNFAGKCMVVLNIHVIYIAAAEKVCRNLTPRLGRLFETGPGKDLGVVSVHIKASSGYSAATVRYLAYGEEHLVEEVADLRLHLSWKVMLDSLHGIPLLCDTIAEMLALGKEKAVITLGTPDFITIPIAKKCNTVFCINEMEKAVRSAFDANLTLNKVRNVMLVDDSSILALPAYQDSFKQYSQVCAVITDESIGTHSLRSTKYLSEVKRLVQLQYVKRVFYICLSHNTDEIFKILCWKKLDNTDPFVIVKVVCVDVVPTKSPAITFSLARVSELEDPTDTRNFKSKSGFTFRGGKKTREKKEHAIKNSLSILEPLLFLEPDYVRSTEPSDGQRIDPSVEQDTMPSLVRGTLPSVRRGTVPSVEQDTVPSVVQGTVPSVEQDTVPSVGRGTVPSVEQDTVPSVGRQGSAPSVEPAALPSVGRGIIHSVGRGIPPKKPFVPFQRFKAEIFAKTVLHDLCGKLNEDFAALMKNNTHGCFFSAQNLRFTPADTSPSECFSSSFRINEETGRLELVSPAPRNLHMLEVFEVIKEFLESSGRPCYNPEANEGFWKTVSVRSNFAGQCMVIMNVHVDNISEAEDVCNELKPQLYILFGNGVVSIHTLATNADNSEHWGPVIGEEFLEEEVGGLWVHIGKTSMLSSFHGIPTLCETVAEMLDLNKETAVITMGTTTFITMFIAKRCSVVYCVQASALALPSVFDVNPTLNGIDNVVHVDEPSEPAVPASGDTAKQFTAVCSVVLDTWSGLKDLQRKKYLLEVKRLSQLSCIKKLLYVCMFPDITHLTLKMLCKRSKENTDPFVMVKVVFVDVEPNSHQANIIILMVRASELKSSTWLQTPNCESAVSKKRPLLSIPITKRKQDDSLDSLSKQKRGFGSVPQMKQTPDEMSIPQTEQKQSDSYVLQSEQKDVGSISQIKQKPNDSFVPQTKENEDVFVPQTKQKPEFGSILQTKQEQEVGSIPETNREKEVGDSIPQTMHVQEVGSVPQTKQEQDVASIPQMKQKPDIGSIPQTKQEQEVGSIPQTNREQEVGGSIPQTKQEQDVASIPQMKQEQDVGSVQNTKQKQDDSSEDTHTVSLSEPAPKSDVSITKSNIISFLRPVKPVSAQIISHQMEVKEMLTKSFLQELCEDLNKDIAVVVKDRTEDCFFKIDKLKLAPKENFLSERFEAHSCPKARTDEHELGYDVAHSPKSPHVLEVYKVVKHFVESSAFPCYNHETNQGFWKSLSVQSNFCGQCMVVFHVHLAEVSAEQVSKELKWNLCNLFRCGRGKFSNVVSAHIKATNVSGAVLWIHAYGKELLQDEVAGLHLQIFKMLSLSSFHGVDTLCVTMAEMLELNEESAVITMDAPDVTTMLIAKRCGILYLVKQLEDDVRSTFDVNLRLNQIDNVMIINRASTLAKPAFTMCAVFSDCFDAVRSQQPDKRLSDAKQLCELSYVKKLLYVCSTTKVAHHSLKIFCKKDQQNTDPFVMVKGVGVNVQGKDLVYYVILLERASELRGSIETRLEENQSTLQEQGSALYSQQQTATQSRLDPQATGNIAPHENLMNLTPNPPSPFFGDSHTAKPPENSITQPSGQVGAQAFDLQNVIGAQLEKQLKDAVAQAMLAETVQSTVGNTFQSIVARMVERNVAKSLQDTVAQMVQSRVAETLTKISPPPNEPEVPVARTEESLEVRSCEETRKMCDGPQGPQPPAPAPVRHATSHCENQPAGAASIPSLFDLRFKNSNQSQHFRDDDIPNKQSAAVQNHDSSTTWNRSIIEDAKGHFDRAQEVHYSSKASFVGSNPGFDRSLIGLHSSLKSDTERYREDAFFLKDSCQQSVIFSRTEVKTNTDGFVDVIPSRNNTQTFPELQRDRNVDVHAMENESNVNSHSRLNERVPAVFHYNIGSNTATELRSTCTISQPNTHFMAGSQIGRDEPGASFGARSSMADLGATGIASAISKSDTSVDPVSRAKWDERDFRTDYASESERFPRGSDSEMARFKRDYNPEMERFSRDPVPKKKVRFSDDSPANGGGWDTNADIGSSTVDSMVAGSASVISRSDTLANPVNQTRCSRPSYDSGMESFTRDFIPRREASYYEDRWDERGTIAEVGANIGGCLVSRIANDVSRSGTLVDPAGRGRWDAQSSRPSHDSEMERFTRDFIPRREASYNDDRWDERGTIAEVGANIGGSPVSRIANDVSKSRSLVDPTGRDRWDAQSSRNSYGSEMERFTRDFIPRREASYNDDRWDERKTIAEVGANIGGSPVSRIANDVSKSRSLVDPTGRDRWDAQSSRNSYGSEMERFTRDFIPRREASYNDDRWDERGTIAEVGANIGGSPVSRIANDVSKSGTLVDPTGRDRWDAQSSRNSYGSEMERFTRDFIPRREVSYNDDRWDERGTIAEVGANIGGSPVSRIANDISKSGSLVDPTGRDRWDVQSSRNSYGLEMESYTKYSVSRKRVHFDGDC